MTRETTTENHRDVVRRTFVEHDTIVEAQRKLESALTRAATKRQRTWANRVASETTQLLEALRNHVDSAEAPGGLLPEMEKRMLAINDRVVYVLKEHKKLVDECQALLAKLVRYGDASGASLSEVRKSAAMLMTSIRQHRAREAELIHDVFAQDAFPRE